MIRRPSLSCSYWWKFVYTVRCHEVILHASIAMVKWTTQYHILHCRRYGWATPRVARPQSERSWTWCLWTHNASSNSAPTSIWSGQPRSRCVSLSTSCGWPWDLQSLQELGSWLFSYLLTRWLLRRPEHYRYDSSSYLTVLLSHCIVRPPVFCSIFRTLISVYTWVCVCVSVCFKFCIESMVDAENGSEVILCVCVSTSSLTQNKTWSRGRRTRYV